MATWPTPPPDASGGYAEILVGDTIDSHKVRVHLAPFNPTTLAYPSAIGGEAGVNDTLQNFMNVLRAGWDATWNMFVNALYHNVSGTLTAIYPLPVAAQSGNNGLTAVTAIDIARATVNTFTMRTTNPAGRTKYVLRLPCWGNHYLNESSPPQVTGDIPQEAVLIQGDPAGTFAQKLVNYLTATNGLVAHDGFKPIGLAKNAVTENKRLRRRYGMA